MRFLKLDLLTLLIGLFLFASCEQTSTIGLEIDPSSAIVGSLVDSVTIQSNTVQEEPVGTTSASRYPLGQLEDDLFGRTTASIAMGLSLPSDIYNFGNDPVIDSAVLVLNYAPGFYGDSTATYSIDVRQLGVNISRETNFLNTRDWTPASAPIGNKTGKLYPTTRYNVTDVVPGKPDTLRSVTPQLRIRLDNAFAQNNIANSPGANLKNNVAFARAINGLHVSMTRTNAADKGGIAFFSFIDQNSSLVLYYKKQNETDVTKKDTVAVDFPISDRTNPIAATTLHNYSAAIQTQLNNPTTNPTTQYPVTYLQPLVGLRNKISFPYLKKFSTEIGKIVVNKAELVIDVSAGTDVIPFNASPRLSLYRYDLAEKRQNLPDNDNATQFSAGDPRAVGSAVFGGYFNSITKQYVFVVTSYVQDLLDGKTIDYGTFLAATPITEFEFFPSLGTAARTVIGSFKKNPAPGDKVLKLNIYYTKIN